MRFISSPGGSPVRVSFLAALFLALIVALGAPRAALADDPLSIIAGNAAPGIFDALELIAAGAGYYKQQHLIVTKDYATNPGTAAQLVASGKADVASLSVEPILIGSEKGLHLIAFLSRQARYSYVLAVLADSPIHELADFKGATLGEVNPGSAVEPAVTSLLGGAGLRPSDFTFVPVGSGSQGLAAVAARRVSGVAFPYIEVVNDTISGNLKFRIYRHPILKDIGNVGYAASAATIASKGDVLRRFSRAIVEAALFVRTNPAAAARLYLEGANQKVTPASLDNITRIFTAFQDDFPAANPANPRIGLILPRDMVLYSRYLADYGFMKAPVVGANVATDQFIGFANDFDHKAVVKQALSMH